MMRLTRLRVIARWEFLSVVRRLPFLFVTLAMPLLMALLFGGVGLLEHRALGALDARELAWGVVDEAGLLSRELTVTNGRGARLARFASEPAARRALAEQQLAGYFVIAPDYLARGRVRLVVRDAGATSGLAAPAAERALATELRRALLTGKLPELERARVLEPMSVERTLASAGGAEPLDAEATLRRIAVPLLLALLMVLSLVTTSSYLVQGVAIEKENRLSEVLLAAVSADELLAGKLLGLGAAGLLQVGVWSLMVSGAALPALASGVVVPWGAVLAAVPLFVLGYLFVGSLMLATGSLGTTQRESQQLGVIWTLPVIAPAALMTALIAEPNGALARVLTFIPFTAPITLVTRLSLEPGGVSPLEIAGSCAALLIGIVIAVKLAARLFRVGLLLTGARPSWRAIWRQARERPEARERDE